MNINNWIKAIKFANKYGHLTDEIFTMIETIVESTKDGQLDNAEKSKLMKQFWDIIKKAQAS